MRAQKFPLENKVRLIIFIVTVNLTEKWTTLFEHFSMIKILNKKKNYKMTVILQG